MKNHHTQTGQRQSSTITHIPISLIIFSGEVIEPISLDGELIIGSWRQGDIELQLELRFARGYTSGEFDNIEIKWTAINRGTDTHNVGMRIILDTQIAGNDGAPFFIPNRGGVTHELELTDESIPDFVQVMDDLANPTLTGEVSFGGGPKSDIFQLAYYKFLKNSADEIEYKVASDVSFASDSAVNIQWNQEPLSTGESTTWIAYYGLGTINSDTSYNLTATLSGPQEVSIKDGAYVPFEVIGNIINNGNADEFDVIAELELPDGLAFVSGYEGLREIGTISPGVENSETLLWKLLATGNPIGTLEYSLNVRSQRNEPFTVSNTIIVPSLPTPTIPPTVTPTETPTVTNTPTPTNTPTSTSTSTPTNTSTPTFTPTPRPTNTPLPPDAPTNTPTATPTRTLTPSNTPTRTYTPTFTPTPTQAPTTDPTIPTPTPSPTAWVVHLCTNKFALIPSSVTQLNSRPDGFIAADFNHDNDVDILTALPEGRRADSTRIRRAITGTVH